MFDTWSKNEQKCWADIHMMRIHPGLFRYTFLSWYSYSLQYNRGSAFFSWDIMARCRERRQEETFKTHLPYKYPLQHNHRTEKKQKTKQNTFSFYTKYGHVIYTTFTHLDHKVQTYIYLSTAHFSNLQCPFGSLLTTTS